MIDEQMCVICLKPWYLLERNRSAERNADYNGTVIKRQEGFVQHLQPLFAVYLFCLQIYAVQVWYSF